MDLDSAITYYEEIAKECRRKTDIEQNDYMDMMDSALEAEQLASWLNELKLLRERIDVQPERKKGEWIDFSMSIKGVPTEACGECGEWSYGMGKNYCPNCGADMRGDSDE